MSIIGEAVEVGFKCVLAVPQENRDWGFNPGPDGKELIIAGWSRIDYGRTGYRAQKPGIYENRARAIVCDETGYTFTIGTFCLDPADPEEYEKLRQAWFAQGDDRFDPGEPIEPLPETPFWEGDRVRTRDTKELLTVVGIRYTSLNGKRDDGSPWPCYTVSENFGAGWSQYATESDLELVERGRIWNLWHDIPNEFADLQDEANFAALVGKVHEVRNPANGLYKWTKDEVLAAIKDGTAHGLRVGSSFFGGGLRDEAVRYDDEDLGRRIAAATLEGFAEEKV